MKTYTSSIRDLTVSINYPDEWFAIDRAVPNLAVPRQLFALSNRQIELTPESNAQPRPMIGALDASAMFIWAYLQRPNEPEMGEVAVPDYKRFVLPLQYDHAETYPASNAREWNAARFMWRRIGVEVRDWRVSVFIWEGAAASNRDLAAAKNAVASLKAA